MQSRTLCQESREEEISKSTTDIILKMRVVLVDETWLGAGEYSKADDFRFFIGKSPPDDLLRVVPVGVFFRGLCLGF